MLLYYYKSKHKIIQIRCDENYIIIKNENNQSKKKSKVNIYDLFINNMGLFTFRNPLRRLVRQRNNSDDNSQQHEVSSLKSKQQQQHEKDDDMISTPSRRQQRREYMTKTSPNMFPQQRKETDSMSLSSIGYHDDNDEDDDDDVIRVRKMNSSDHSSTWDEYEKRDDNNDSTRSVTASSLIRILIQQQHDERRRKKQLQHQQQRDQQQELIDDGDNTEHEIDFESSINDSLHHSVDENHRHEVPDNKNHKGNSNSNQGNSKMDDEDDDDIPIFLRQKCTVMGHGILFTSESVLHPKNYTQNNHVLVNYEREKRSNLKPYFRNIHMDQLAREHAERMATENTLFHSVDNITELQDILHPLPVTTTTTTTEAATVEGKSGSNSIMSLQHTNNNNLALFHVAENVLRGDSVRSIHDESMLHINHPDRKNILSNQFTEFGMGTAVVYHHESNDNDNARPKKTIYMVQLFRSTPTSSLPNNGIPSFVSVNEEEVVVVDIE